MIIEGKKSLTSLIAIYSTTVLCDVISKKVNSLVYLKLIALKVNRDSND